MSIQELRPRVKLWLETPEGQGIGPGLRELMRGIQSQGTLRDAARLERMSYRHAWSLLREAEQHIGVSLTHARPGGTSGGGTTLTAEADELLERWDNLEQQVSEFANSTFEKCFSAPSR